MGSRVVKVPNLGIVQNIAENSNRSAREDSGTRRFGVFELDLRAGELRRNGMRVKLQEQPFQVLALLLEQPGEVVTREDLRNRLWPADTFVDFDHSLNAAIKRLRNALGDSAENPTFVETVARRGYRFLAPVSTTLPNGNGTSTAAPTIVPPSNAETSAHTSSRSHLWWMVAVLAAVVLVLVGLKLGLMLARGHSSAPPVRITRLTANPEDDRVRASAISRDGRYLAFDDETGFYLRQIDTGETHPLPLPEGLKVAYLSWFPDSAHLIAALTGTRRESSLWEISVMGGSARKLLDDARWPAVSPDGKQVAFVTGKKMQEQIWLMGPDGAQTRKLAGEQGDFFGALAWSPDSTRIAYTRRKFSYALGVNGAIEVLDVRTQRVRSLQQASTLGWFNNLDGPLAWVPDGHLIYALNEPRPRQLESNLWSVALDSEGQPVGTPQRLTNDPGAVLSITTSADGKRVAYLKGVPQPDVYIARLEPHNTISSEPQRLTLDDRQDIPFDWTPDSKSVLFMSDRTGAFSVYRQAIDQPVPEMLVTSDRQVMTPRMSPDGTQILYLVYPNWSDKTSTSTLMRVPLAGGAPQPVIEGPLVSNQQCARAPATLCLYGVFSNSAFSFYSFDPLKGNSALVYQIKDALPNDYNWSLSPDGTMLAIGRGKQSVEDSRIRLVWLKTGSEKWLTISGWPGVASLDWAADSKSLWAPSAGDEENTLLNIDLQGHIRPVWQPKKMSVRWAIPSRDGRYLALHVASDSSNVWMVER
jgi:DNA-binding winged helix-turn-helix (wHTH) protein/Tol biopolymer transport system component